MKTINVFICNEPNKQSIMEKLSVFYKGKYTATGNIWFLNVPECEHAIALNAIEYCLAGHNIHTKIFGKNTIITFNN